MIIGIKDILKLAGIAVIACCAVFVCTLFLNYNIDLAGVASEIKTEAGMAMYRAQTSMGKVTAAVSGGCLLLTSVIMLLFYVKDYIDAHGKELGILKALGYGNLRIAKHFWLFGVSVFAGCATGFIGAFLYLPRFYKVQNAEKLFPDFSAHFHASLAIFLVFAPAVFFALIAIFYTALKLKTPVLDLLKERRKEKSNNKNKEMRNMPFLKALRRNTLHEKKALSFFIFFSAFCFSAMTQMSFSMRELASDTFAYMIITIGLILAFVTLILSLTTVVKANAKTIAMMRVTGYHHRDCGKAIFGGYRPIALIGFAVGSIYQYLLLKIMVTVVFADIDLVPEYYFDFAAMAVSFVVFIVAYELILYSYSLRIKKLSLKSIMLE